MNGTHADKRDDDLRRLEDIRPEEVSTVDAAANRRKFLVVKRAGESGDGALQPDGNGGFTTPAGEPVPVDKQEKLKIPAAVKGEIASAITEALERLATIVNRVKEADETDERLEQPLPAELGKEISAVQAIVDGVTRRYKSPAKAEKDEGGEGEGAAKQKLTIPGPVKTAVLARLTEVMERLMSAAEAVKGAEDTEETDMPLPESLGRELTTIASMIGAVTQKYPSATTRAAHPDDEPDDAKDEDEEKAKAAKAKAEAEATAKSNSEALKVLGAMKSMLDNLNLPAPAAASAAAPTAKQAEPRPAPAPTHPAPDPRVEETLARVAKAVGNLENLTKVVTDQGKTLKRIAKARGLRNGISVEKNDVDAPTPKNEWPGDLNDEPAEEAA